MAKYQPFKGKKYFVLKLDFNCLKKRNVFISEWSFNLLYQDKLKKKEK